MNKLTKVAMLAAMAASAAAVSASAQNVSTSATDLILGFEITDNSGQGATSNLEFDLGSSANYTQTSSFTLPAVDVADLVATYGSNWATRSDLAWGVGGQVSTTASNLPFDLTVSAPASAKNTSSFNSTYGAVGGLYNTLGQTAHTANSTAAGVVANSNAQSWTGERTNGGMSSSDFQFFNPTGVTDLNYSGAGTAVGTLELYSFFNSSGRTPAAPTNLGDFSLTSSGAFSYNGIDATPEPSAYALGICAVVLFLVLRRRQTVA